MNNIRRIIQSAMALCVVFLLMTTLNGDALAGWEQVGANDAVYLFADRNTIRKDGVRAIMSHLIDFKARPPENGVNYQSSKLETEYDCKENRFQDLSVTFHPHRMAEGGTIAAVTGGHGWQPIVPGSSTELLSDIACNRSKRAIKSKMK